MRCPHCKMSLKIIEVMSQVTVYSEVRGMDEFGDLDYGEQTNEDGVVDGYDCAECGARLANLKEDLKEYFE